MEDSEIVELFWARDEKAVSAAARKYGSYCTTIAANILHNDQDAEECVNDAYFRAWNSIPPNRPRSLCAFLGRITRNAALDRYKLLHADKRGGGEPELLLDEIGELVSNTHSVEQEAEHKELVAAINAFLAKTPEHKRKLFISRYFLCKSVPEIADYYGMSESNVSVTLNRIRKKLKEHLEKRGFEI